MSQRRSRCGHRRSKGPGNSQVPVLSFVSTLESGTAVPTDGESRRQIMPTLLCHRDRGGKSLRFDDREGAFDRLEPPFDLRCDRSDPVETRRTPLYDFHLANGARMVPFAGWDMPVQYPDGIRTEHLATRAGAGLFDVSHMAQVRLTGADRDSTLEALTPTDVAGIARRQGALFHVP